MDVSNGDLVITLSNTLDADLDTVVVTIVDLSDNHIVGISNFENGLPDNATRSDTISIDGQRISNLFLVSFHAATIDTSIIQNPGEPHLLTAEISFLEGLTVTSGRTVTPEITFLRSQSVELTDSTKIISSIIAGGNLTVAVENTSNIPFTVTVSSSNFTYGGNAFSINQLINGNSSTLIERELAGYNLIPADSGSSQYIEINFDFFASSSEPIQYDIEQSDGAVVDVNTTEIVFSTITGRIRPTEVDIEPAVYDLNFPNNYGEIRLSQTQMIINLYNDSSVPMDIELNIEGGGESMIVTQRILGKASPSDPPQLNTIIMEGDELVDFLTPAPDSIYISGLTVLNPDYEITTINDYDNLSGEVILSSPFTLEIDEAVDVYLDISEREIDGSIRPDDFTDTFVGGSVELVIESQLPLDVALTLYFNDRPDTSYLYHDPASLVVGPETIQAGILDENGNVIESRLLSLSIDLLSENLGVFDSDTIYMAPIIRLLPTAGTGVSVMSDNFISIQANGLIDIRIGGNLWQ
jgi:hypothetical protein